MYIVVVEFCNGGGGRLGLYSSSAHPYLLYCSGYIAACLLTAVVSNVLVT